jgi:hypothetical protein
MTQGIRFGSQLGSSKPVLRSWPPQGPDAAEVLFGDFCNFLGKIWLRADDSAIQNTTVFTAHMDVAAEAYCAYRESDPVIDLSQGLALEESLLVSQAVAGFPLTCLLNLTMAQNAVQSDGRMQWLSPQDLVLAIRHGCRGIFDTDRNVVSQIREQGSTAEGMQALLFDGSVGHSVLIRGVERGSGKLLCWDPIGVRSCLGKGRNQAGVAATLVKTREFFWVVPGDELASILFCVFERCEVQHE